MSRKYLRGEIYYADLDPVVGSEQMGTRPVLILQNNVGNHFARTVIVAPITSRIHTKSKIPTHSYIGMIGSMKYPSVVMLSSCAPWISAASVTISANFPKKKCRM